MRGVPSSLMIWGEFPLPIKKKNMVRISMLVMLCRGGGGGRSPTNTPGNAWFGGVMTAAPSVAGGGGSVGAAVGGAAGGAGGGGGAASPRSARSWSLIVLLMSNVEERTFEMTAGSAHPRRWVIHYRQARPTPPEPRDTPPLDHPSSSTTSGRASSSLFAAMSMNFDDAAREFTKS